MEAPVFFQDYFFLVNGSVGRKCGSIIECYSNRKRWHSNNEKVNDRYCSIVLESINYDYEAHFFSRLNWRLSVSAFSCLCFEIIRFYFSNGNLVLVIVYGNVILMNISMEPNQPSSKRSSGSNGIGNYRTFNTIFHFYRLSLCQKPLQTTIIELKVCN